MEKIIEHYISIGSSLPEIICENEVMNYGRYRIEAYNRDNPDDLAYISKNRKAIKAFFDAEHEHFQKDNFYGRLYADSIKDNTSMLKVARDIETEKIVAMTVYSSKCGCMTCVGGSKLVTDDLRLREIANHAWIQIMLEDVKLFGQFVWIECSAVVEDTWEALGGVKIPHTYLDMFMDEDTLADIIPCNDDPYRYRRRVAKGHQEAWLVNKVILGFPNADVLKQYISDKSVMLDELCLQYKDASSFDVLERINYRILPENIWSDLRLMIHYEQLMHYFEESSYEGIVFEMTEKELNVLTQCTLRAHDAIGPIGAKIWDTVWASDDYQEFISLLTRTMVNINRSNVIKTRIFGTDKLEPEEYIFPTDYWFKVQCLF